MWPTPQTLLLLRAALLDGDSARAAFRAWLAESPPSSPSELASADRRLLPLVGARMRALELEHDYLAVCDEVGRTTRERNQGHLAGAAEALTSLERAGISALALKGLPMIVEHYPEPALRPMADVDLMVRPADLSSALTALRAAGWRAHLVPRRLRRWVKSFDLVRPESRQKIDLHQYLIEYGASPETDGALWSRAHEIDVLGARCLSPSPTDLLVHVCIAALKYGRHRNSRWVPDAMLLLRERRLDWAQLVESAARRGVTLPVRECLQYLVDELQAPVPQGALTELWRLPVSRAQITRYRVLTERAPSLPQLAREYLSLYRFAVRASGSRPSPSGLGEFAIAQLAHRWNVEHPWRVIPLIGMQLRRKVVGRLLDDGHP